MDSQEIISPEDVLEKMLIDEYIEGLLTELTNKKSVRFSDYNHGEIYRLKMDGYSNIEIGRIYNLTGSFISTMIHWIEKRLRLMVTRSNVLL